MPEIAIPKLDPPGVFSVYTLRQSEPFFMRVVAHLCLAVTLLTATAAEAKVRIEVDLDKQTIHVEARDKTFDWKVSSGKPGYETPAGNFKVLWMDKDHHSDEYDQAYMPNAIFFAPGFAIHGFGKSPWGHKASHGCVRIPVAKSAILFDLVKAENGAAEIVITGESPTVAPTVASVEASRAAKGDQLGADSVDGHDYGASDYGIRDAGKPAPVVVAPRGGDGLFGSMY